MIFVHLTQALEPPDFDEQVGNDIHPVLSYYGSAELKVAVREQYPIHGNWKLALENFLECYHCGPSHRALVTTHTWDQEMSRRQRAQRAPMRMKSPAIWNVLGLRLRRTVWALRQTFGGLQSLSCRTGV